MSGSGSAGVVRWRQAMTRSWRASLISRLRETIFDEDWIKVHRLMADGLGQGAPRNKREVVPTWVHSLMFYGRYYDMAMATTTTDYVEVTHQHPTSYLLHRNNIKPLEVTRRQPLFWHPILFCGLFVAFCRILPQDRTCSDICRIQLLRKTLDVVPICLTCLGNFQSLAEQVAWRSQQPQKITTRLHLLSLKTPMDVTNLNKYS